MVERLACSIKPCYTLCNFQSSQTTDDYHEGIVAIALVLTLNCWSYITLWSTCETGSRMAITSQSCDQRHPAQNNSDSLRDLSWPSHRPVSTKQLLEMTLTGQPVFPITFTIIIIIIIINIIVFLCFLILFSNLF